MRQKRLEARNKRNLTKQQGKSDLLANAAKNAAKQKKFNEENGLNPETMDELTKTNISIMASQNEKLIKKLSKRQTELLADQNLADAKQRNKIETELREIEALKRKYDAYEELGGQDAMKKLKAMEQLNNEINRLVNQGKIDIKIDNAKGENKVKDVNANSRASRLINKAKAIHKGVTSLFATTKEDITAARNKSVKTKVKGSMEIYKQGMKNLEKVMKNHELTEEQKTKLMEDIIQKAMLEAEAAK